MQSFRKRHPNIAVRIPERVSKGRARVTEATIRNWFLKLSNYLDEIGQSSILEDPNRIFNSDETGVVLCPKARKVISLRGTKNVYEVSMYLQRTKENLSITYILQ